MTTWTAGDIAIEHRMALTSLTLDQQRAISRIGQARQRSAFNGLGPDGNLAEIFAEEARRRNRFAGG